MTEPTTTERRLAIGVGILILAAATDVAVRKAGGYGSDYSRLLIALACGVVTGAYILGRAWSMSRKLAIAILCTLCCGEGYNLWQTAERVMNGREAGRAPARAALKQHEEAEAALKAAEGAQVTSARLTLALTAQKLAKAAYDKELREGGRCKSICNGLKADAEKADKDVTSAITEAEGMKAKSISVAKADLAAHPLPASGTVSSDETGIPVWVLDLISAVLLSLGANGLAGALIAFGAHRSVSDAGQSDFSVSNDDFLGLKAMVSGDLPEPTPPKPRKRKKPETVSGTNVISFQQHPVVTALKSNGGAVSSNQELADLMGVSKGEASKRWQEIENQLVLTRHGKHLRIALKA